MNNEIKELLILLNSSSWSKEAKSLLDYITNLQEENERLKQPQMFIDTMDMEERYGQELYEDYLKEQLEDYKSRIDKAIRYIKKCRDYHKNYHKEEKIFPDEITSLLMILQGEDK